MDKNKMEKLTIPECCEVISRTAAKCGIKEEEVVEVDISKSDENGIRNMKTLLNLVKTVGAVDKVTADFKEMIGYEEQTPMQNALADAYLHIVAVNFPPTVTQLTLQNYVLNKPWKSMLPLWNRVHTLNIGSDEKQLLDFEQSARVMSEWKNVKAIVIRNLGARLPFGNIMEQLPNNEVENIIYNFDEPVKWQKVINRKKRLTSLDVSFAGNEVITNTANLEVVFIEIQPPQNMVERKCLEENILKFIHAPKMRDIFIKTEWPAIALSILKRTNRAVELDMFKIQVVFPKDGMSDGIYDEACRRITMASGEFTRTAPIIQRTRDLKEKTDVDEVLMAYTDIKPLNEKEKEDIVRSDLNCRA